MNKDTVYMNHNSGFFSCCSVLLNHIVNYIAYYKKLPKIIETHKTFKLYKNKDDINRDITFDYFEHYDNFKDIDIISLNINYQHTHQFYEYANLDYTNIAPLIKKYFSPSVKINKYVNDIEKKYNIVHDNTIAVYYRGTDKYSETKLAPYDEFYNQIINITNTNNNINILLQTDSADFIDYINEKNLKNVIIIDENKTSYSNKGIHNEQKNNDINYQDMFYFLSTIIIMSKCKYIICSSGNCSLWIMLYKGNKENIVQYLNGKWYRSIN